MNQSQIVCCIPGCFETDSKLPNSLHTAFYGLKQEWMVLLKKYLDRTGTKSSWNSINLRSSTICAKHFKLSGIPNILVYSEKSPYYLDAPVFFPYLKIGVSTKPAGVESFNFVQFSVDADEGVGREETFPIVEDDILQNMQEKPYTEELETQECLHLMDHTYAKCFDLAKAGEIANRKFSERYMANLRSANHQLKMQIMIKEHQVDNHFKNILDNEVVLKFYTGFNFLGFSDFSSLLHYDYSIAWMTDDAKYLKLVQRSKEYRKQLIIILAKLRLGLLHDDLAYRFNISVTEISIIWNFFLGFLRDTLSKYAYVLCAPETIICDLIAITCRRIILRGSDGVSHNQYTQAKGLLRLTPSGFIRNTSNLYVSHHSESEDLLVDDQQWKTICLSKSQRHLLRKLKMTGSTPLSSKTRVDRISALISEFRILKGVYTVDSSNHDQLNLHWRVCCYLMNFIMSAQ